MKKLFIIIGILLILLIVGTWAYLFIYGAPENAKDIYAKFGLGGEPSFETDRGPLEESVVDTGSPERLKQLTVRPVAGAVFTEEGVVYVAQGTGHIYHIDLGSGEEKILSGTTVPEARHALFSDDASYVAITKMSGEESDTVVGFIDGLSGRLDGVSLPPHARELSFTNASDTVRYLLPTNRGSAGYAYDMDRGESTELFAIPLRDVRMLWGIATYTYTTPSASQKGYLYRVGGKNLEYMHPGAFALMAMGYDGGVIVTERMNDRIVSGVLKDATTTPLRSVLIPEKCTQGGIDIILCGVPNDLSSSNFPDAWYMGTLSYSDSLVRIDASTGEEVLLSDLFAESGREIDIAKIGIDEFNERLYFINKNDNTLWMFDMTVE